jgi:hypothetical protein
MQLLGRAKLLSEEENPKGKVKFLRGANFLKGGEFPRNFVGGAKFLGHRHGILSAENHHGFNCSHDTE